MHAEGLCSSQEYAQDMQADAEPCECLTGVYGYIYMYTAKQHHTASEAL